MVDNSYKYHNSTIEAHIYKTITGLWTCEVNHKSGNVYSGWHHYDTREEIIELLEGCFNEKLEEIK